jgi:hypothetical protein
MPAVAWWLTDRWYWRFSPGGQSLRESGYARRHQRRSMGAQYRTQDLDLHHVGGRDADPPTLFCQVGSTQLKYQLRCIDDLYAWLVEQRDWVELGAADEQKPAKDGTVEAWGRLSRQSGRRVVRGCVRDIADVSAVSATAPGGPRQGRADPRSP